MLVETRHDLDEVARPMAIIELVHQNFVPGILAGAGRARQAEDIGPVGDPGGRPRLDRRRADLLETHHEKQRRERVHLFLEQRFDGFRRDVAPGEAGAAGGDDHVDDRIGDPGFDARVDRLDVVGHDAALGDQMTGGADTLHQERAGFVVLEIARVGNRQYRDFQRHELFLLIDPRHGYTFTPNRD